MIESFGRRQDVVFMGRRSFRMEIAGGSGVNELAIPLGASSIPTERIYASDRQLALEPTWLRRSPRGNATTRTVVLCVSAFAFGILLTWTFNRWAAGERARVAPAAVAAPALAESPASGAVIVQLPSTAAIEQHPLDEQSDIDRAILAKTLAALDAARARPTGRALARVSRPAAIRVPRPTRTAKAAPVEPSSDAPSSPKPWVDPFAE